MWWQNSIVNQVFSVKLLEIILICALENGDWLIDWKTCHVKPGTFLIDIFTAQITHFYIALLKIDIK